MACCSKTDFRLAVNSPRSSQSFETERTQLSSRYHEAVFPLDTKWQRRFMRRSIFLLSGNWEYLGKKNLPWAHWPWGITVLNREVVEGLAISPETIKAASSREERELERREREYRDGRP